MNDLIRTPDDVAAAPVNALVDRWAAARTRAIVAKYVREVPPDPADLLAELALGTRIVREVSAGRWCAVADLLRANGVDSWAQIGAALAVTETEARDGFAEWITSQVDLWHRSNGTIGMSEAAATELHALSGAITW